jgi:hypothetical protein
VAGESDDFQRHFGASLQGRIETRLWDTVLGGDVVRDENDPVRRLRKVSIRTSEENVRPILLKLLKA